MSPIDDGARGPLHRREARAPPCTARTRREVGTVIEVLDNYREHIFDGLVFEGHDGKLRFVDAPEVARTAERGVTLRIPAAQAEDLPPPQSGPGTFRIRTGRLSRRLFGGWKRQ